MICPHCGKEIPDEEEEEQTTTFNLDESWLVALAVAINRAGGLYGVLQ